MKSKDVLIKSFHSILLIMITLLMNITLSFGQNDMTKIKDGSVGGSNQTATPFSILELESTTKGFLLPRMTTDQRNKLTPKITDKERGNGLAIYNVDDDCINYWSSAASKWLSVCGALPPATLELNCDKISLNATGQTELTQGRSLRDTDILYVSVNVTNTGSFSISAITENGYSFSKSGVFETTGVYTVALEGFGTPMSDNINPGDLVSFSINGKKVTTLKCSNYRVKVKSSAIDFEVISSTAITWKAYKGIALNAEVNKVTLKVKVNTAGFWRIQGDKTENGISLNGSGEFEDIDVGKTVDVVVYAQGSPREVGINKFKFITNSANNKTPNITVDLTVVAASFSFACEKLPGEFTPRGVYQEGSTLNKGNSITVPVKVINPGLIDIEMTGSFTGSGSTAIVKFSALGTFLSKEGEIQMITLYANSVKIPLNTSNITLTGVTPGTVTLCDNFPVIPVTERSKVYTFNCNYISPVRMIRVNRALVAGQDGLRVSVDVGFADVYKIKTNTLNGVSFEKSGVFTDADRDEGTAEVTLTGTGIPLEAGTFNFEITAMGKDDKVLQNCTVAVNFVGPDITILALGTQAYAPTGKGDGYGVSAILNNSSLFGPNGVVKVNSIKVLTNKSVARFPDNLATYLETNNVDIVLIAYPTTYSLQEEKVLLDFIKRKKIVVIMADELNVDESTSYTAGGNTNQLIADLANSRYQQAYVGRAGTGSSYTLVNKVNGPSADPIISSDFGSMSNGYLGNDYNLRISYFKNLPTDYIPIAVSTVDPNLVWIFRHNDYGFIFLGDGGIFAGRAGHSSNVIFPVLFNASGALLSKDYLNYGQGGSYPVKNSLLYANTLKWAIEFILKNK